MRKSTCAQHNEMKILMELYKVYFVHLVIIQMKNMRPIKVNRVSKIRTSGNLGTKTYVS